MPRTIMFSKTFPKYHKRAGQPTFFREKLRTGFMMLDKCEFDAFDKEKLSKLGGKIIYDPKFHTIRAGHRFNVGDYFSPREWYGRPYVSSQVKIWDDVQVKKTWNFEFHPEHGFFLEGVMIDISKTMIPLHDGLSVSDFVFWFDRKAGFDGQIICWNDKLDYDEYIRDPSPQLF